MKTHTHQKEALRFVVQEESLLLNFLLTHLRKYSRHNIKAMLANKQILVDGQVQNTYNYALSLGQEVEVLSEKAPEMQKLKGMTILFEDEHLIVINKKTGLLSIATEKVREYNAYWILSDYLKKTNPTHRIFVVHRLDRETSGVMIFAKSERVQELLQENWGPTTKLRTYLALVEGQVSPLDGTVHSYLTENKAMVMYSTKDTNIGKEAITHYETLQNNRRFTLLKVNLETGRKNQIRVHAKDIGHPIVGDEKYGATQNPIGRLGLHAWVLAFKHPITGKEHYFETPVPRDFLMVF